MGKKTRLATITSHRNAKEKDKWDLKAYFKLTKASRYIRHVVGHTLQVRRCHNCPQTQESQLTTEPIRDLGKRTQMTVYKNQQFLCQQYPGIKYNRSKILFTKATKISNYLELNFKTGLENFTEIKKNV